MLNDEHLVGCSFHRDGDGRRRRDQAAFVLGHDIDDKNRGLRELNDEV